MTDIERLINVSDARIEIMRGGEIRDIGPILLWVQRTQRASQNLAADLAVELANVLDREVVACFCLSPGYPSATLRAYHFMCQGLTELPEAFAWRGIGWEFLIGVPSMEITRLASRLNASLIVTDVAPTGPGASWKRDLAPSVDVPVVTVDADVVVPSSHFPKLEWAPRTIRPKIGRLLGRYLHLSSDLSAIRRSTHRVGPNPMHALEGLSCDRTVGPVTGRTGGRTAACLRLDWFVKHHLSTYDVDRNRADIDGSSGMSAFLHFGQISPVEVACRAAAELADSDRLAALESFFNELIVQRELAINFALREPLHMTYAGIPEWGRKTLEKHRSDARSVIYAREQLETGRTHDRLWNAAQRQLVCEGFMPNRLRMYWAKQFLNWTGSAEEAFALAVLLNDRYFLDGRDPNGYAGIAWSIGGRHDRPFPPERPIFGLVRPLGLNSLRKHFPVDAYVARIERDYPEL